MKNFLLLSCFIIVTVFFLQNEMYAQWAHTGPEGGEVRAFCASGTNIFVAPWSGGIYRSTDDGTNWTEVNNGLVDINIRVTALFAYGTNVFAGTWGSGVFLSTNYGNSWVDVNNSATAGTFVHAFLNNGTSVFMGSQGGGVFRTTDYGTSWVQVNNGLLSLDVRDLAVLDTTIFAATWGPYKVFKSIDNGANWAEASNGITFSLDDPCLTVSGGNVFLGTYSHGVYRTTDDGANWTEVNNGIPAASTIREFAVNNTNIFAATRGSGVYTTTDNGISWNSVNNGLTTSRVEAMLSNGSQDLFAGTFGKGIFRSTNNGTDWFEANTDFNAMPVYAYHTIPDGVGGQNLLAGTTVGVYLSSDNGMEWNYIGLEGYWVTGLAVIGTDIFASTMGSGVFRSTDNGVTWSQSGLASSMLQTIFSNGTDLYAGAAFFGGASRSTDNGNTWANVPGLEYKWVMSFTANENHIFAGAIYGGAFRSDDNGSSFVPINNGLDNRVSTLTVMGDSTIFAGTGDPNGQAAIGIYRSFDNGNNWTQINSGLPPTLMVWSFAVTDSNLFASSSTSGGSAANVYLSTDKGENWTSVTTGLVSNYILSLYIKGSTLFAGTIGSGTWWRPLSEMLPATLPAAPSNLIAVADTFSVDLSWDDNSGNEDGFKIERKDDSLHIPGAWTLVDSVGSNVTIFTDAGLVPNTVYSYRVYAYNSAGNSASDSVETVTIVPVELSSFAATVEGNRVTINWTTETETNNRGFEVERNQISGIRGQHSKFGIWENIGYAAGFGTTTKPKSYSFADNNIAPGNYAYRLKQIDFNGSFEYSQAVEVEISLPKEFSLSQNYPNPFNPATSIEYTIPEDGFVTLRVFNALGQEVTRLVNENTKAGIHHAAFDASNLSSGVYYYSVQFDNKILVKKMIVLK